MRSWLSTSRPRFGKALFTARGIARSGLAFVTKGSGLPRREHCASCAKTYFRPTSDLADPMAHDGRIKTQRVDEMWGTDMTATLTVAEGNAAIFFAIDHCSLEVVGNHAAKRGMRFEALEPIRQGVRHSFGVFVQNVAQGLTLRHDHGSQFIAEDFQQEIAFLGIKDSASYVREPQGNGIANALSVSSRKIFSGSAASRPSRSSGWRFWPSRKPTTGGGGLVGTATDRRLRSGKSRKPRSPGQHNFQGETVQEILDGPVTKSV